MTKKEQIWGSHQPVLLALLSGVKPNTVIECGCGNYSTKHLQKCVSDLITIEHDKKWAGRISQNAPANHTWIVQEFEARNGTSISELSSEEWSKIVSFYSNLGKRLPPCDILFVDTFRSCRVPAILGLGDLAKIIILHDLEPPSNEHYQYKLIQSTLQDKHKYIYRPNVAPWTAVYSCVPLPLEKMTKILIQESQRLWGVNVRLEENND